MSNVGQPLDRTDGLLKVTGQARYSAEFQVPRLVHAVLVQSTVPAGRITRVDTHVAQAMPGVLLVMTHENAPRLPNDGKPALEPPAGRVLSLLQDDQVHYNGQPVAVVVGDTLEHAQAAARMVRVEVAQQPARLDFETARADAHSPGKVQTQSADTMRGDMASGMAQAAQRIEAIYGTPMEAHNPMEPHATIAVWEGDSLTLYDSTQYVSGVRRTVARTLGLSPDKLRVVCPFVGGGFGCKGSVWSHVVLAAMAARQAGRPVKLVLERAQMFGPVGGRPRTEQRIAMGAASDGRFTAISHDSLTTTSMIEDWTEPCAIVTRMLYDTPNQRTTHRLARLNVGTPTFQRAPGEATGTFALEVALDEMAYALGIDPVELRLRNDAAQDPEKRIPWSSKSLAACYRTGAERFGWARRNPQPGSMREGTTRVGWGMATATYPANRSAAAATARYLPDGTAQVESGSQDLGTGTYTVMTQVAADAMGMPVDRVLFSLGDTRMPEAPVSGGSQSVASVSPAVQAAGQQARDALIAAAIADASSPLHGLAAGAITVADGVLSAHSGAREPAAAVVARYGRPIEVTAKVQPGEEKQKFSMHSFGAVFAEVHVDADLGVIRVSRIVGSYGVGRLLNAKTGRSQLMGGIVWGMGMALFEESLLDPRYGRIVNNNLAEYHVPVNADVPDIDILVLDEADPHINPLGAKGIGEIGITGVPAAIANAVYHATGRRVRELPITLDKLI
ncbi:MULTISPECIES: xanthine dehydrogenase family protein molybdopterin-binding subunit [Ralstonia]|jgi:xanthine dehydrogenase YagR molybdenum-binding subunit|uniref:Xanthine dehydrogenase, molybdenum binding subunit apoprotein n=1 Tax=Ralstonia pickettii OR214 TaxID=1264675 RepID=R0CRC6_RALPI|nr:MULTISPECIES: xanthine dehydrogenase family protein molybdopterin-binding subunit [Ralstonia]MEA3268695.1 xanthine dehydrogenase family protein molybdopterin-binding subunit [Pseudomonadota bacterium]ENZ78980.1 xanthine dehydrogenase, molybdenum binding subunit apoprotein [Ralstonia pickettii OR214]MBL4776989.1 xanthine dehydrogenase family protein molybdopterin-binding subunit [Ralstonia sp.]MCM3581159.1 xanthine dehydrogenase family protein molybdopterin-binding subunit [Ralstonia picketti